MPFIFSFVFGFIPFIFIPFFLFPFIVVPVAVAVASVLIIWLNNGGSEFVTDLTSDLIGGEIEAVSAITGDFIGGIFYEDTCPRLNFFQRRLKNIFKSNNMMIRQFNKSFFEMFCPPDYDDVWWTLIRKDQYDLLRNSFPWPELKRAIFPERKDKTMNVLSKS